MTTLEHRRASLVGDPQWPVRLLLALAFLISVPVSLSPASAETPSPVRDDEPSASSGTSAGKEESKAAELPTKDVQFVVAQHAIIHVDGEKKRVVDQAELERIVNDVAKRAIVHPRYHSTRAGIERAEGKLKTLRWKIYKELWDKKRIKGMTMGSISPRAYPRWDRIRTDQDLVPDPKRMKSGRVVDGDGKPVPGAEVFLLPQEHINGVYLKDGLIRSRLDEHLVHSGDQGDFQVDPLDDEHWIVATHVSGFVAKAMNDLNDDWELQLKPWAVLIGNAYGPRTEAEAAAADSPQLSDHPVSISSDANIGFAFHIYETDVAKDGSFVQPNVPPGEIGISRSFRTSRSSSMSFSENSRTLKAGEVASIGFSPVTEGMKAQLATETERNKAAEK